jgi:hypothetical protein
MTRCSTSASTRTRPRKIDQVRGIAAFSDPMGEEIEPAIPMPCWASNLLDSISPTAMRSPRRVGLLGSVVKFGIKRNFCLRSRAFASTQEQRLTRTMIEIEAVDQIIGILVTLRKWIEVKPLLDEFQH